MPDIQHKKIESVIAQLEGIHSTITVAVAALKEQASGIDEDIASVLRRGAADRIQEQIEVLSQLLGNNVV